MNLRLFFSDLFKATNTYTRIDPRTGKQEIVNVPWWVREKKKKPDKPVSYVLPGVGLASTAKDRELKQKAEEDKKKAELHEMQEREKAIQRKRRINRDLKKNQLTFDFLAEHPKDPQGLQQQDMPAFFKGGIIGLYDLFKAINIEKSKHKEYREFKGHTRTLPNGKIVPVSEYHRIMDVKGEEDDNKRNTGKEDSRSQGIPEKAGDEIRPEDELPEHRYSGFIGQWVDSRRSIGIRRGGLSGFDKRTIRLIAETVTNWPFTARMFINRRILHNEEFVVLRRKEDIPQHLIDRYNRTDGMCVEGKRIEFVDGIHKDVDDRILRHETAHLLINSINQEVIQNYNQTGSIGSMKIGSHFDNEVKKISMKIPNEINKVVEFCSRVNIKKIKTPNNTFLIDNIEKMRLVLYAISNTNRHGGYDTTADLWSDLTKEIPPFCSPLREVGKHMGINLPIGNQSLTVAWHNWLVSRYKYILSVSYRRNEPVAYACGDDPEVFKKIFDAAYYDFPMLFSDKGVKKSMLTKLFSLFKAMQQQSLFDHLSADDKPERSFFDLGEDEPESAKPKTKHKEQTSFRATTRTNPLTGKVSSVASHFQSVNKIAEPESLTIPGVDLSDSEVEKRQKVKAAEDAAKAEELEKKKEKAEIMRLKMHNERLKQAQGNFTEFDLHNMANRRGEKQGSFDLESLMSKSLSNLVNIYLQLHPKPTSHDAECLAQRLDVHKSLIMRMIKDRDNG